MTHDRVKRLILFNYNGRFQAAGIPFTATDRSSVIFKLYLNMVEMSCGDAKLMISLIPIR